MAIRYTKIPDWKYKGNDVYYGVDDGVVTTPPNPNLLADWTMVNAAGVFGGASVKAEVAGPNTGTKAQILAFAAARSGFHFDFGNLVVGKKYTFSANVKVNGTVVAPFEFNYWDGGSTDNYSATITPTSSWVRVKHTFTAVASAGPHAGLALVNNTRKIAGEIAVYGLKLEEGEVATSYVPPTTPGTGGGTTPPPAGAPTIGGGNVNAPAVGPAPSSGISFGGTMVTNLTFGTAAPTTDPNSPTVRDYTTLWDHMSPYFVGLGGSWGAGNATRTQYANYLTVAEIPPEPNVENPLKGRGFTSFGVGFDDNYPPNNRWHRLTANSIICDVRPRIGHEGKQTLGYHEVGYGYLRNREPLPNPAHIGRDIYIETRFRVLPKAGQDLRWYWHAVWSIGDNPSTNDTYTWEIDWIEDFGYDNGGGGNNFHATRYHANAPWNATNDTGWNWHDHDLKQWTTVGCLLRKNHTYEAWVGGHRVQTGVLTKTDYTRWWMMLDNVHVGPSHNANPAGCDNCANRSWVDAAQLPFSYEYSHYRVWMS